MRRHKTNRLRKFESLESRQMMAGDISFDNHILTITGAGYNDTAQIRFEGDKVHVDLYSAESIGDTDPDHHDEDKDIDEVTKIVFNGFAGEDKVEVVVNTLDSGETLDNISLEFHGGDNNDTLTQKTGGGIRTVANGDAGDDTLQGSRFTDTLDGGANNDTYVFSGSTMGTDVVSEAANVDRDTLDFSDFSGPIIIDIGKTSANSFGSAGSLTLSTNTGIEDVKGTAGNDYLFGNSRENHLFGQGGRDTLEGRAGNDTLEGGADSDKYVFGAGSLGTDTIVEDANVDTDSLDFTGMTHSVGVDLGKVGSNYAVSNTDLKLSLSNDTAIENVYGTNYDDKLVGNSRDNVLYGYGGRDGIQGMAGVDTLYGGADDDIIYADSADYVYGGLGDDFITGYKESSSPTNHRPGHNLDWGLI
jgi:Ca2+-binding RTX toxin-like protein